MLVPRQAGFQFCVVLLFEWLQSRLKSPFYSAGRRTGRFMPFQVYMYESERRVLGWDLNTSHQVYFPITATLHEGKVGPRNKNYDFLAGKFSLHPVMFTKFCTFDVFPLFTEIYSLEYCKMHLKQFFLRKVKRSMIIGLPSCPKDDRRPGTKW